MYMFMIKQINNSKDISLNSKIYAELETIIGIQIWKSTKYLYKNDSNIWYGSNENNHKLSITYWY